MAKKLEIKVDMDKKCSKCGKMGATQNGMCIKCTGDSIMAKKPAIVTTAKIKKCTVTPECGDMSFDGFDFTSEQYKKISQWVKSKDLLEITLSPFQENLPGLE